MVVVAEAVAVQPIPWEGNLPDFLKALEETDLIDRSFGHGKNPPIIKRVPMSLIYHVVPAKDWATFENEMTYEAASLHTEGFIHLSTENQVTGVLERYYQGVPDLLLLHVDPTLLTAELKYEVSTNNERFPHLYGPLNKNAVVTVQRLGQ